MQDILNNPHKIFYLFTFRNYICIIKLNPIKYFIEYFNIKKIK